jgi:glycosyltransferase involved in cell wall biosynthesis
MKRITVVVTTYNGSRFLLPQLESIERQSLLPSELIISDDASTDDTYDLALRYAKAAPFPTRVMRNPRRLGYIENFFRALSHARFEYIAYCDQDDMWHPQKLAVCCDALVKSNAVMCTHTANLIDENSHRIGSFAQGIAKDQIFPPLTLSPWGLFAGFTQVFDARLLTLIPAATRGMEYLNSDQLLSHDRWVYFLASCFGNVVTLSRPLTDYRQHQSNLFGPRDPRTLTDKIVAKVTESSQNLLLHRDMAKQRSEILLQFTKHNCCAELNASAERAHLYWSKISELYDLRAQLYRAQNLGSRLTLLRSLLAAGAYRQYKSGGLQPIKFPKDIWLGLFGRTDKYILHRSNRSGGDTQPRL